MAQEKGTLHISEYSWINLLYNRNGIPDWTEIRVAHKVSIIYDWKSYAQRLSIIEKESGTTIVSNQHGFIFIIGQICRRISACCGVGRQPDRISMDIWNRDLETKDETIKVVKQWFSDIADLRTRHKLVVVMRDNAGENKSQEIPRILRIRGSTKSFQYAQGAMAKLGSWINH